MSRKLTKFFLEALKREFPFLKGWEPELHSAERPVEFKVQRRLDANKVWKLELGRYNNTPDDSYHSGVTVVYISDGTNLTRFVLDEGETRPEDVVRDDTKFIVVKESWRSQLVYDDPGRATYTLHKRVQEAVEAIKKDAEQSAVAMRQQLEL